MPDECTKMPALRGSALLIVEKPFFFCFQLLLMYSCFPQCNKWWFVSLYLSNVPSKSEGKDAGTSDALRLKVQRAHKGRCEEDEKNVTQGLEFCHTFKNVLPYCNSL